MTTNNSYQTLSTLDINSKTYHFHSLKSLEKAGFKIETLPFSIKILLENLLRQEDGISVKKSDIENLANWNGKGSENEIAFMPSRVILQDFTGVPAVADLAAMRDAMASWGGDPKKINPLLPAELVIDHSVQIDYFGTPDSFAKNAELEFERNRERYEFLRWGQNAFKNFKVVPPDTGIVHQVNIEYLARVVFSAEKEGKIWAYPDTVVGTDSHTTMVNALGVLGWGVGGIEAEAAMLGQAITMLIPEVIGVKLTGKLPEGATATDLVLTLTNLLRKKGVVEKFVEFFGAGLDNLALADRSTIANMAPEFGSTCGIFPIDDETIKYLKLTGRSQEEIDLVAAYAKTQGLYRTKETKDPNYTSILELDLGTITPTLAGPKRPHDKVDLTQIKKQFEKELPGLLVSKKGNGDLNAKADITINNQNITLTNGSVVIAAITSCTNTSNPAVLLTAGLLAKKAVEKGLVTKPWVKTSLAPGSKVVTRYLEKSGLLTFLNKLGFNIVAYGCTTCIGNSGPLHDEINKAIEEKSLVVSAVLSGNRNFEGRIHPLVRANFLGSPPLVVAFALKGTMDWDPYNQPLGKSSDGKDVYLKDIWPTSAEIQKSLLESVTEEMFRSEYSKVFEGDENWKSIKPVESQVYKWDTHSTYIQRPPFFDNLSKNTTPITDIQNARVLALLGDSITTDHISPAGSIGKNTPAGIYLQSRGVTPTDFNSYGARRGSHDVMIRGTLANVRLKNEMVPGTEGGFSKIFPERTETTLFETSMEYQKRNTPLVIIAGKEYGSGSSRDWAAKGTILLGVKAVIAESFERIHRSNLIGMGVLPLTFVDGQNRKTLALTGEEIINIEGLETNLTPRKKVTVTATLISGKTLNFEALVRIDTPVELEYYKHGGILPYVLRGLV